MKQSFKLAAAAYVVVAMAVAVASCSRQSSSTPLSPTAATGASSRASADATLKVTKPVNMSPANGALLEQGDIVLTVKNSDPLFDPTLSSKLSYSFELWTTDSPSVMIYAGPTVTGTAGTTSHQIPSTVELVGERAYKWHVRSYFPELGNSEYSDFTTFVAPTNKGYIKVVPGGSELYDPMLDGTTVGQRVGPMTYIPGKGFQMDSEQSWIEYIMPETCRQCEFSAIVNQLHSVSSTEDPKNTVISARVCCAAFNDNAYRLSVDKRGNNAVAWRFITGDTSSYIETLGPNERPVVNFRFANQYFVEARWRNQVFTVTYRQDGPNGPLMYQASKPYGREYRPTPMAVYAGRPWVAGERGEPSTVEGMIIRQMWMSPNPRPAFANR
jgi:hypothetical protein